MIFRPLCIDYHSRAQEIIIAAEESSSALRLLPTQHLDERNLYNELEKENGDTNYGDDRMRIESTSNDDSGDLDENGEVGILIY